MQACTPALHTHLHHLHDLAKDGANAGHVSKLHTREAFLAGSALGPAQARGGGSSDIGWSRSRGADHGRTGAAAAATLAFGVKGRRSQAHGGSSSSSSSSSSSDACI